MMTENIVIGILMAMILTALVNFIKHKVRASSEQSNVANQMLITYNKFIAIILGGMIILGLIDGSLVTYFDSLEIEWLQIFFFGFTVIILMSTLYLNVYKSKKEQEYKNDERWKAIIAKVNKNLYHFNDILILLAAIAVIMPTIIDTTSWSMGFDRVAMIIFYVLNLRNIVELIQLHVYDLKM